MSVHKPQIEHLNLQVLGNLNALCLSCAEPQHCVLIQFVFPEFACPVSKNCLLSAMTLSCFLGRDMACAVLCASTFCLMCE